MINDDPRIPGWYGKIPNLGDFASRRLPSRFIVPWDDWLQRTLAGTRALLGEAWLKAYLTSPLWRFLLMPAVCGNTGWGGVLMPSVDRVGRYFPLSIAIELPLVPWREGQFDALSRWLEGVEHAALAALDVDHTAEDLDRALGATLLPVLGAREDPIEALQERLADRLVAHSAPPAWLTLPSLDSFASLLCGAGTRILLRAAIGKSLWWSRSREGGSPLMLCCEGLPAPDDFALLLNGGALERVQASAN